ncbi:GNAT family N-acetyltransferase [Collimonas humicola]|uniref:GNAT family N-acetyltransferase n=1 Tax=Collimonas humicola TaxID=2825886 RepID=UPI001B8D42D8|nr:GNAT family protein [Collimonas humicola]
MEVFPLETARLMLRPFTRSDLPAFTAYRNQPDVARYQSWSSYTEADAEAFFAQQDGLVFDSDDSWFQIAVERKDDGVLVGDVAVHFFDDGRQAELGVTFDLSCQRLGYAQEAVSAVIQLLFAELGKRRLVATVDVLNLRAQRLLDIHGFRREGHYRENIFFKGTWSDEYSYALLSHEWQRPEAAVLRARDA